MDVKYELGDLKCASLTSPYLAINIRGWFQRNGEGPLYPGRRGLGLKFRHFRRLLQIEDRVTKHRDDIEEEMATKTREDEEKAAAHQKAVDADLMEARACAEKLLQKLRQKKKTTEEDEKTVKKISNVIDSMEVKAEELKAGMRDAGRSGTKRKAHSDDKLDDQWLKLPVRSCRQQAKKQKIDA